MFARNLSNVGVTATTPPTSAFEMPAAAGIMRATGAPVAPPAVTLEIVVCSRVSTGSFVNAEQLAAEHQFIVVAPPHTSLPCARSDWPARKLSVSVGLSIAPSIVTCGRFPALPLEPQ